MEIKIKDDISNIKFSFDLYGNLYLHPLNSKSVYKLIIIENGPHPQPFNYIPIKRKMNIKKFIFFSNFATGIIN